MNDNIFDNMYEINTASHSDNSNVKYADKSQTNSDSIILSEESIESTGSNYSVAESVYCCEDYDYISTIV